MRVLILLCIVALLGVGCQSGRIPCPKPGGKTSKKVPKRMKSYALLNTAEARTQEARSGTKPNDTRFVSNVNVEEWDCPEPGGKKYLPKRIRKNIRKNYDRLSDERRKAQTDSLARH